MGALLDWLAAHGADVDRVILTSDDPTERVLRARRDIGAGERALVIPRACLLTPSLADEDDDPSVQSHLAADILRERDDPRSPWRGYIDLLPTSFSSVPFFFGKDDLALLRGSYLLDRIAVRRASMQREFESLRARGRLAGASFEAFVWARFVVCSRVFGIVIRGERILAMVPMADMLDHRIPPDVRWGYDDADEAFVMTAERDIRDGEPVHDSYGHKCNGRFLWSYGFVLDDNPDNTAEVRLSVPRSDPGFEAKMRLLGGASRACLVSSRLGSEETRQALAFLRIAHASEGELRAAPARRRGDIPLGARSEARALAALAAACAETLRRFPTSLEDDEALLRAGGLAPTARSCVVMRRGEKQVLVRLRAAAEAGGKLGASPEAPAGTAPADRGRGRAGRVDDLGAKEAW